MDFNSNKNTGKRKAQSIHDMINASPGMSAGIKRSAYKGPKNPTTSDNSSLNLNIPLGESDSSSKWGNSNVGMPQPKKQRVKADVPNPMRGSLFSKSKKQETPKGYIIQSGSNYSGPKTKRPRSISQRDDLDRDSRFEGGYDNTNTSQAQYPGVLDDVGYVIFCVLLAVCVIITLVVSGLKPRKNNYTYPLNIFSMSGVINRIHESKMGISDVKENSALTIDKASSDTSTYSETSENTKVVEAMSESDLNKLGEDEKPAVLDDGSMTFDGYSKATSHEELVSQIEQALSDNDFSFVAAKLAYENENTGKTASYPVSVVKHFCEYMSGNSDKRAAFITAIKKEEYEGKNGTAQIIMLPQMKFTVRLGENTDKLYLDNTVISVSGFSEQIANANQNAAIYPLLPCIYEVTMTNSAWPSPQKQEIEATLGEGNLDVSVGKGN